MAKKLIIAEKPSVAADIARALGGFVRKGDYFESDNYVLSSAVGHLLELTLPEKYDAKRGKWSFTRLPVIPPHFDLAPIEKSETRLNLLLRLMKRKDVTGLINACDAGREGELIFRYIVQHAHNKKPIERLWLQSMTPQSIREGFSSLRADKELLPLADAAKSRSEADWLIGINGTRAMTAFNSKEGGFYLTTVGRVQTPTLAILVEREERIRAFTSRDYWEVHARFGAKAGDYPGRWFDAAFKKDDDGERKSERLWQQAQAEAIVAGCRGKSGIASEETKPTTQLSPLLYDLTSLQREANGRFGFPARMTLSLAQALYERHKVLTYPRTDSRALPEDYLGTVKKTLEALGETRDFAPFARQILKQGWVKPNKRIFDNSKISDHFAIIPTLQTPRSLNEAEQKLYDLVVRRFLSVFYPAAESMQTTRITRVGEHQFKTEGKVLVNPGWLAVYGRVGGEENDNLPAIAADEKVAVRDVAVHANQTKPPPRYTEATLLSAMEGAGKLVEDDELRAAMAAKGLGTPATRAATIEGLIREEYVHREGRELVPTPKAFSLMFALHMLHIVELGSPELTGEWEHKLKLIEAGKLTREEFMRGINDLVRNVVGVIKNGEIPDVAYATVPAPCPKCGGVVQENYRKVQCQKCDFTLWRVVSGREWAPEELAELFTKRFVGPLTGFRSKQGRPFSAGMRLNDEMRLEFDFGQGAGDGDEAPDFSGQEPLGACPKCAARVFEHGVAYVCEKAVGPERKCDFRSGRLILQQPIEREQMKKLLETGRTDLLTSFVSKKNRKFKAFLVKQPDGKIGFEFQPRAPKEPKNKAPEEKTTRPGSARRAR
ncbi:MAG TPA: DNA topoisomerase III [Burkholderiales bacterium]|nr:DNA topoisomerase III [Burkholderiales bacterium]